MIELADIRKSYKTDSFEQKALDGVSVTFRDNEFVAILGASGSGKTTLLNVLGGLDHADSGDLLINGVSTKKYTDKDWDTYRNHHIGFIFQSYNLIPHQTVLSNVELALTLSGVSREDRLRRATEELERVGLGEHIHKKPSQLSGGQMQRVAIARALVNDPDIMLADEPTGALDTETGLQVMNLLSEIARDRLVIMVTHNPDLATSYANRLIRLKDGKIIDDDNPVSEEEITAAHLASQTVAAASVAAGGASASETGAAADNAEADTAEAATDGSDADTAASGAEKGCKKYASMSFLTALSLSFNNLMTKKGRTFLTAFAGSIGIIGIAAILALSNGVNQYIAKVEEDTLSSYPLTITQSSFDMTSMLSDQQGSVIGGNASASSSADTSVDTSSRIPEKTMITDMVAKIKNNDLSSFKTYLQSGQSDIDSYVNTIKYDYGIEPQIYKNDTSSGIVQLNPASINDAMGMSASAYSSSSMMSTSIFQEMIDDQPLLDSQYDVVAGHWPEKYDECVLVLSKTGTISDYTLYNMGILNPEELKNIAQKAMNSEKVDAPNVDVSFTYDDALNTSFKVVNSCNLYQRNDETGTWTDMSDDSAFMTTQVENGTTIKIVGIVQPDATTTSPALSQGIAYTGDLTTHLMDEAGASQIVQEQKANSDVDVFTGKTFEELQSDNGGSLNMDSLFSIDTDALSSALSMDSGSMDSSDMSSALDTGSIESMMQSMPMPDFSSMSTNLTAKQKQQLSSEATQLLSGFLPYYFQQHPGAVIDATTDVTADFAAYLSTPDAQTRMAAIASIIGTATSDQIQSIMTSYMTNSLQPFLQQVITEMAQQMASAMAASVSDQMTSLSSNLGNAFANAISFNMTEADLTSILKSYMNADTLTYDSNLTTLGYAEKDKPSSISIYPYDFEAKENVLSIIDDYNQQMTDAGKSDSVISYSDVMGSLISSVTDIVNMIGYVLIAFVSISLVVSSIMIGIITYISVLERRKEIGILRAMGASKRNIANVFNAETIIEGLIAGVFAIAVVLLVSLPVNAIVLLLFQVADIMTLPWTSALALIGISVLLTFIAGLIPSSAASRRDPVEALRSE